MSTRRLVIALLTLGCLPLVAQQASPAPQATATPKPPNIPDKFTNLMVLPATITKPELVGIMKQFCITFQVRCSHCHEVSDDLSEGSFASDTKPAKADARKLMRLIHESGAAPKP